MTLVTYRSTDVNGLKVFYRESGNSDADEIATAIRKFLPGQQL
jgi:hypothetical protein